MAKSWLPWDHDKLSDEAQRTEANLSEGRRVANRNARQFQRTQARKENTGRGRADHTKKPQQDD